MLQKECSSCGGGGMHSLNLGGDRGVRTDWV